MSWVSLAPSLACQTALRGLLWATCTRLFPFFWPPNQLCSPPRCFWLEIKCALRFRNRFWSQMATPPCFQFRNRWLPFFSEPVCACEIESALCLYFEIYSLPKNITDLQSYFNRFNRNQLFAFNPRNTRFLNTKTRLHFVHIRLPYQPE